MRLKYFRALTHVIALGLMLAGLSGCGINKIPTLDEQVKAAWSEVVDE
jgi:LemA protein